MNGSSSPDPEAGTASRQNFIPGMCVDGKSGQLTEAPGLSVIFEPVRVTAGTVIRPLKGDPVRIRCYSPVIRPELIHTYTYDPDANYTTFVPDAFPEAFSPDAVKLPEEGYIRIELQGITDDPLTERVAIVSRGSEQPETYKTFPGAEQRIIKKINALREEPDTLLLLLSDTHYGCGCNFEQTAACIRSLAEKVHPDALIHLGDLTDGSLPRAWTEKYARRVISGLKHACSPCYFLIGNHDHNYFRGNPDLFTRQQCEKLYLDGEPENRIIDLKEKRLRLIFISSFDPEEKHRYGFRPETVCFLIRAVMTAPRGSRLIIFSHVPPLGEIHYWDRNIRNAGCIVRILECAQKIRGNILAFIHGHNHCDQVYTRRSFPIIGIGASKLEDFQDKKPEGSVTYPRNQYDETAILFDLLLIKNRELCFLRCGAGEDRTVHAEL